MNLTRFGKNWDFALRNNAVLLIAVLFLSLALMVTSILAFFNRERVVLVPPRLDDKMLVAWNNAGAEYFKAFGLFVATLLGNITPANSKFVADQLSVFIEPKLYAPIRTQVLAYADDPRFARAASFNYFSPNKVVWEPSTAKVFVMGTITMSSFNPQISGPYEYRTVVYEFKFMMNDGRPLIVDFNSYPGNEARTLAWIDKNQRVLDKEAKEREKKGGALITPATLDQGAENTPQNPDKGGAPEGDTKPVDADKSVPPGSVSAPVPSAGAPAGAPAGTPAGAPAGAPPTPSTTGPALPAPGGTLPALPTPPATIAPPAPALGTTPSVRPSPPGKADAVLPLSPPSPPPKSGAQPATQPGGR